jgi:hypothetical protein
VSPKKPVVQLMEMMPAELMMMQECLSGDLHSLAAMSYCSTYEVSLA